MDEVSRTYIDGGFGGLGTGGTLGVGALGGLVLGSLWNGNGFGWGNRGNGVGYDTGAINAMQGQLNNISGQIANADRDLLMQTSNQNQFIGNLVNQTGDAIVGAITSGNQGIQNSICCLGQNMQNAVFQNTLTQVQSQGATNLGMCQGFGSVNASIDRGFGLLNNNVTSQGYESRLQAQQLASQQQHCCCEVKTAIEREGCANRELQREIQYQNTRDQLAKSEAENQSLKAQLFSTNQVNAQTNILLNAIANIKTTTA